MSEELQQEENLKSSDVSDDVNHEGPTDDFGAGLDDVGSDNGEQTEGEGDEGAPRRRRRRRRRSRGNGADVPKSEAKRS